MADTKGIQSFRCIPRDAGMTLRDWFAGMAVSGILASPQLNRMKSPEELASDCYRIADGLMRERAQ
jgi:hypothetical protein